MIDIKTYVVAYYGDGQRQESRSQNKGFWWEWWISSWRFEPQPTPFDIVTLTGPGKGAYLTFEEED